MNFGDCPYCNDFTGFFEVPEKTPAFAKVQCQSCGKEIWYRLSRIDPQSWTIEDFEKEFIIDHENHRIQERNPKPQIQIPPEIMGEYIKIVEDYFLYGDSSGEKPLGILNAESLIDRRGEQQ